jgi:LysR family cyn operon transcriptional activator
MNLFTGIKLRQLQYFLAVAEKMNFSKAAEKVFVTQPTLSHQIAELESHVGTALFDRSGKMVRLTEAGRIFATHATKALQELDSGCTALRELEGLQRGSLNIGATQSFVRKLLPPLLGDFMNRYPAVRINVQEMTATQIERQLANGNLDLGIAFEPSIMEETELEPILKERLLLVVSPRHELADLSVVKLKQLDNQPLVFFSQEFSTRQLVDHYFGTLPISLNLVCETNSIEVMLGVVSQTNVATILPEGTIPRDSNLHVMPIVEPELVRVSALLWSRHSFRTFAARTFADMLRKHFLSRLPLAV